ncbi:DMT family transporter [Sansalvadorimonas sp. 2012CJ34-2]|uniref:DMT family transporter n=1 Tax=Parendozoicomonas callyspongiae TaxID=2942213 RepID=A0ABT0PES9_9GAMM|nr:DMT family transporter [Sansalvadorimonas sp. 2012CJ34-2]MCL6269766.1 DMT family transporter [Sansalvadorimonas sp. 2012CJ34-2]
MENSSHLKADLVLFLVTILAACGWVFSKEALAEMPSLLFIGIRFFSAGLFLFITNRGAWKTLNSSPLRHKVWITGGTQAVAMLCWIQGLALGLHMGTGSFITSLGVVFVPVVAWLLFREPASKSTWLALPVAVSGLGFLSLEGGFHSDPGLIWFLLAAILFSLQFTFLSRIAGKIPAVPLTAAQLTLVGLAGLITSAMVETWPAEVSGEIIGWLLASILIATSLRFSLQTYGQSLAPVSHAALIMVLEPVWTTLAAVVWFNETMATAQMVGCSLIFSALLISRWRLLIPRRYAS